METSGGTGGGGVQGLGKELAGEVVITHFSFPRMREREGKESGAGKTLHVEGMMRLFQSLRLISASFLRSRHSRVNQVAR